MGRRKKVPITKDESLFIGPADVEECEVHLWPTKGLARRLVKAMRDRPFDR